VRDLATIEVLESGEVVRVHVVGELDPSNAVDVQERIASLMPNEAIGMVLDLSGVGYLDSSGIRTILTLVGRFRWRGQRLLLIAPEGSQVRRVLELAGAAEALHSEPADDLGIAERPRSPDGPAPG
jgi:anti-sigma B factor antagonist